MNETLKVLKERRSCRKFKEDMITNEELESVLEAGTYAPTGNGKQSPIIIAITNKKIRDELSLENRKVGNMPEGFDPFYNAPVILAVLADKSVKTYLYDGSLVMGNMLNACEITGDYEGIGFCAIGYMDCEKSSPALRKENYIYYIK